MNTLTSNLTREVIDNKGFIYPKTLADRFHTTVKDVAVLTGISIHILSKRDRVRSRGSQQRLHEIVSIINRVTPWCGDAFQAYAWFRSEPLPGFGGLTAEELVKDGRAQAVQGYIASIAEGGYA
ncbi:MAG TPA: DUF2384 domain-containing protein [Acidiferrobacteraceae bacterium]|nr:DUF2384 domain-containing protein [Acidiferrobacteraceae bacterium]